MPKKASSSAGCRLASRPTNFGVRPGLPTAASSLASGCGVASAAGAATRSQASTAADGRRDGTGIIWRILLVNCRRAYRAWLRATRADRLAKL
jgi:hypothetical protein